MFFLLTICLGALSFSYLGTDMFNVKELLGMFCSTVTVLMFGSPLSVLVSLNLFYLHSFSLLFFFEGGGSVKI